MGDGEAVQDVAEEELCYRYKWLSSFSLVRRMLRLAFTDDEANRCVGKVVLEWSSWKKELWTVRNGAS